MTKKILMLLCIISLASCKKEYGDLPDGLYAEIETTKGTILTTLEFTKAPVTVANFVTLAEGKNEFVSPEYLGKPFYQNLQFHRVIPSFMIQGGDPMGDGSGSPGYKFKDEISELTHSKSGTLSMANAGPATNGSQFFITHVPTPFLDGKHTVFGYVIGDGMKVVNQIQMGDQIKNVHIIRKGEEAKKFNAVKIFSDYVATDKENQLKNAADAELERAANLQKSQELFAKTAEDFTAIKAKAAKTSTGLKYQITKKGTNKKPKNGSTAFVEYAGFLENGQLFDSSSDSIAKVYGKFDQRRESASMYQPIPYKVGKKDGMIPGFIEGLEKLNIGDEAILFIPSHLGYGPQGAGDAIPPNANIIFSVKLLEKNN